MPSRTRTLVAGLIKIGDANPSLRPAIREVLASVSKTAENVTQTTVWFSKLIGTRSVKGKWLLTGEAKKGGPLKVIFEIDSEGGWVLSTEAIKGVRMGEVLASGDNSAAGKEKLRTAFARLGARYFFWDQTR